MTCMSQVSCSFCFPLLNKYYTKSTGVHERYLIQSLLTDNFRNGVDYEANKRKLKRVSTSWYDLLVSSNDVDC